MKILQVLPTLGAGGAEGFVANLGVSLATLGVDVCFYLLAGARAERGRHLLRRLHESNIDVVGAEERSIRSPQNLLRLAWLSRSWRPDVVQANLYSTEVVCALVRLLMPRSSTCFARRLATSKLDIKSMRRLDRAFDLTIACSPAVEASYKKVIAGGIKGTLATVSNGGLLQQTIPSDDEQRQARRAIGIPATAFVVAHIGRMYGGGREDMTLQAEPKAQDVLLKSFAHAFCGDETKRLILLGDGPLRPQAQELARTLGIMAQTHFLGQQPEPWPILKAANIFCFPSRWEGLPNVLPEAASCGLPIVASNIPEIRDLYPGDAWLLKEVDDVQGFANGLQEVAANIQQYKDRAARIAPTIRERFSMETCARKYMGAYEAALARKRKS